MAKEIKVSLAERCTGRMSPITFSWFSPSPEADVCSNNQFKTKRGAIASARRWCKRFGLTMVLEEE